MAAPAPRMHGLTHTHGGPDPAFIAWETVGGGGYADQILTNPDLVHYWRMGAMSGDQPDASPHIGGPVDLKPQVAGAPGTYHVAGALGSDDDGAYETGAGGHTATDTFYTGAAAHRGNFAGNAPLTVELWAWINPAWTTDTGYMVSMGSSGFLVWAFGMAAVGTPPYRLQFQRGTSGGYSTLGITGGEWHHLAATYDGTTTRFYVDGALWLSESNTTGIPTSTQPIRVGTQSSSSDNNFWGKLDEVALYTVCLTDAEIAAHHTAGAA